MPEEDFTTLKAIVGPDNVDLYRLFIESYIALLHDSPMDASKPPSVVKKFYYELLTTPPLVLIGKYARLGDALLKGLRLNPDVLTDTFLDGFRDTPVFREYHAFLKSGDPRTLTFLLSFCWFGKKLDYKDESFYATAFRQWLDVEDRLGQIQLDRGLVSALRVIVAQLLDPSMFDDTILLPANGSGSTAERAKQAIDKFEQLSMPIELAWEFEVGLAYRRFTRSQALDYYMSRRDEVRSRARLMFVPKNYKTARSVCLEPIGHMLLQQEVMRWMVNCMSTSEIHRYVTLEDQTRNQQYAIAGSANFTCATIDLSAASDSLHLDLVKGIFPDYLLRYLIGTRSSQVETPDGQDVCVKKFAPMGSALCFPVQCTVFTAITLLGYVMTYYECDRVEDIDQSWFWLHNIERFRRDKMQPDPEVYLTGKLLVPCVYGDDIIVDDRSLDNVLLLLDASGLVVNVDKSFYGDQLVRESCGVFAYAGHDVTPYFLRVKQFLHALGPSSYASLVEATNRAGDFSYWKLHSVLVNSLRRLPKEGVKRRYSHLVAFSSERRAGFVYTTNVHVPVHSRYTRAFQRFMDTNPEAAGRCVDSGICAGVEMLVIGVRARGGELIRNDEFDAYRHDMWQRARLREVAIQALNPGKSPPSSSDHIWSEAIKRPSLTRLRTEWVPA